MQRDLPIYELRDSLRTAWNTHNRLVLIAPTGSGKTTQVCQMLYEDRMASGQNIKRIVVLQPRRVAARSVARRVAEEMGVPVGGLVGYQVRFDEQLSADTRIAFVTEGILLRWLQSDPRLGQVDAVLFDEFHERNLLSDIALAWCKQLQQQSRPDLRLIVMSATLEATPVAAYLAEPGDANAVPILESQGRSYPVEMHYQSWDDDSPVWERAARQAVDILQRTETGDVLVFMPGMNEINRTIDETRRLWRDQRGKDTPPVMLALHGEMPPREQDRIFAPSDYRRVIVATNVAETSITIPGVRYVIDSGQARIARYDPARGVNTLHIEPISQASAAQRAGRAGRVAPGQAYRLWSEKHQTARALKNTPEVQRTELSAVVLLLHSLGVQDVATFDFLDKPDATRIQAAEALLESLGAIQGEATSRTITEVGQQMLRIPAHPRYARMLIEAQAFGCVREVALLAALVSGRDLLMRLGRDDQVQRRNRAGLLKKGQNASDYFLLANAFAYAAQNNFDGKACFQFGINAHVAREVAQTRAQLLEVCVESDLLAVPNSTETTEANEADEAANAAAQPISLTNTALLEAIPRCHLAGFLDHLAVRTSSGSDEYDLAGGHRCTLMDESIVGRNMLIVASEIREITRYNGERLTLLGFGSAVQLSWVREMQPMGFNEQVEYVYDRLNKRVVAGRISRYHDLILGGERLDLTDIDAATRVLAAEFAHQLGKLPQWGRLKKILADQSDLPREVAIEALAEAWQGATTFEEAAKRDVVEAFRKRLTPNS